MGSSFDCSRANRLHSLVALSSKFLYGFFDFIGTRVVVLALINSFAAKFFISELLLTKSIPTPDISVFKKDKVKNTNNKKDAVLLLSLDLFIANSPDLFDITKSKIEYIADKGKTNGPEPLAK